MSCGGAHLSVLMKSGSAPSEGHTISEVIRAIWCAGSASHHKSVVIRAIVPDHSPCCGAPHLHDARLGGEKDLRLVVDVRDVGVVEDLGGGDAAQVLAAVDQLVGGLVCLVAEEPALQGARSEVIRAI